MILTSSYSRIAAEPRAWMIDPDGKIYSCGRNHKYCISRNPELARLIAPGFDPSNYLVEQGWAKAGFFPEVIYFEVNGFTDNELRLFQGLAESIKDVKDDWQVDLSTSIKSMRFRYKDFRFFGSVVELEKFYRVNKYK